jgi:arylsulfatase A-like enzyme
LAPHDEGVLERLKNPPRDPRPAPRHDGAFEDEPLPRPASFNERNIADKPSFVAQHPRLGKRDIARLTRAHRSRLESLLAVDDLVGGLVDELRTAGVLDETLFIYTSDQGYLKGEHRLKGKERVYDPAVHVPLVIRGPGIPAGEARFQPTVSPDLARTIAAATGAQPNVALDGVDLRPLARNPAKGSNREILLEFLSERHFAAVRTRRYAFAKHQNGETELYDFREDPDQLENVVADPAYAEVARRLDNELSELRVCAGTSCERETNPGKSR